MSSCSIGNPNSTNFFVSEEQGKNARVIPINPPIPVETVQQTPNRAPISESLSAVDPTTGASRPISM